MNIIETTWKWNGNLSGRASTEYIALHHAAALNCTAADVDRWHKANGWSGIGYHFFVRKDGSIYRGRPLHKMGAHVEGMNNCSVGICAEGDYDIEKVMPEAQKKAIKALLRYLKGIYPSAKIVGHREIGASDCPGEYYPLEELKNYYKTEENEDMGKIEEHEKKVTSLEKELKALKNPMIYNYVDENMPEWARPTIQKMKDNGYLQGDEEGKLGLTYELLRIFVTNDRAGLYDHRWDGKGAVDAKNVPIIG